MAVSLQHCPRTYRLRYFIAVCLAADLLYLQNYGYGNNQGGYGQGGGYGQSSNPHGQQSGNPYAQQSGNPYAQQSSNPYGQQQSNPYAQQQSNSYGQQQPQQPQQPHQQQSNPYSRPQRDNPYAQGPGMALTRPQYGGQNNNTPGANAGMANGGAGKITPQMVLCFRLTRRRQREHPHGCRWRRWRTTAGR